LKSLEQLAWLNPPHGPAGGGGDGGDGGGGGGGKGALQMKLNTRISNAPPVFSFGFPSILPVPKK
jgi:hypothetical protein